MSANYNLQPEPYSIHYDARRSAACEHALHRIANAAGPWRNMISNRPAFRSKINKKADRVQYQRAEANTLIDDPELNYILEMEGLKGQDANVYRVESDRPKHFSYSNESTASEAQAKQFTAQMSSIFYNA